MKAVTILGSTGSIGVSTLDVISRHPDKYQVFALTANQNVDVMLQQCQQFQPRYVVMVDDAAAAQLRENVKVQNLACEVLQGTQALEDVASDGEVDYVMAAIVGAAGLLPTLAAAKTGKRILLANKEALVMTGDLFMQAVEQGGAELLPVDSEHNAIFQCMPSDKKMGIERIVLTASGGPFLHTPISALENISPAQAVAHPTWSMGRKISVDSATMMNKGLEVIEAHYLFGMKPDVLIHPQSVIHSMVSYSDGSVLAQMGHPDMRTPIAHCLAWPERISSGVKQLDLLDVAKLEFCEMNFERFPCLQLAYDALAAGGTASAILNAANEIAVAAFLGEHIKYTQIYTVVAEVLASTSVQSANTIEDVLHADKQARHRAENIIKSL
tara:strand:- start:56941 stop:58092 length:1152 start_codon:yes stop_codon:yes gene_type:complete